MPKKRKVRRLQKGPTQRQLDSAFAAALRQGGQRLRQLSGPVDIHERRGDRTERVSALDLTTYARPIWRIRRLTPGQRRVAGMYGFLVEQVASGGPSSFLQDKVDGGGGGDIRLTLAEYSRHVDRANRAMARMAPITYEVKRGRRWIGQHRPIPPAWIVHYVAVRGMGVAEIARLYQWEVEQEFRQEENGRERVHTRKVVPTRQSDRITDGLIAALDVIEAEWQASGGPRLDRGDVVEPR